MYNTPRRPLPTIDMNVLNFADPKVILGFSNLHKRTSTTIGHYFNYLEELSASGSRYQINLSEDSTIRLNESLLKDYYGRYQPDNIHSPLAYSYHLNHITCSHLRYPSSKILWVIQHPGPNAHFAKYSARKAEMVTNNYLSTPDNLVITPVICNNSSLVPESLSELFPELGERGFLLSNRVLPNTFTLDRVTPEALALNANDRRLRIGPCTGWADTDGPIAFLDRETEGLIAADTGTEELTFLKVETVFPAKTTGPGWSVGKMKLSNYQGEPGMFFLIERKILNVSSNGVLKEVPVTQLMHFRTSYHEARANTNLSTAIDMMVLDMYSKKNYWDKHPVALTKFDIINRYFPKQSEHLGKSFANLILKTKSSERPDYETMIKEGKILSEDHLKKIGFPKLLARTEKGRAYKRCLVATQSKEKLLTESDLLVKQHQARRTKILAQRTVAVNKLVGMKAQINAIEVDVKRWNQALEVETNKLAATKLDYDTLQAIAEKSKVTEQNILDEIGITSSPNIKQIWLKQNWLIIDIQYQNKISQEVVSVKANSELSMNTNWFLHKIIVRTIRPNIIRVGAREPNWEQTYGKRVGGPYLFEITSYSPEDAPKIHLWPAERSTILAILPEHRINTVTAKTCKLHPHTNGHILNITEPSEIAQFFTGSQNVCPGEATTALYQCFQNEDLSLILMTLNSWVTNADPSDTWGKYYSWFPRPEEVPCLVHQFSFETKKLVYFSSTSAQNHLFYELVFVDGLGGLTLRFGSMVAQGSSWIIPTVGGRTLSITCSAEEVEKEATTRINTILKKGYTPYKGTLINQTASIEAALVESVNTKDNNEIIGT